MWLFCSWLILSNSFASVERRFYLKSIQRFGSTNWTTGLRKSLWNLPIIDLLVSDCCNTSSFTAKQRDSAGVHCVLCLPLRPPFSAWDTNRIKSFIFLINYLNSHFLLSAGRPISSWKLPFLNPGTYLVCEASILFVNIRERKDWSHCHRHNVTFANGSHVDLCTQ